MIPLANSQKSLALRVLKEVFDIAGNKWTISNKVAERAIIFPAYYVLDDRQAKALFSTMEFLEIKYCYLSLIERFEDSKKNNDWLIPIDRVIEYPFAEGYFRGLENVLFSPKGDWGIAFSMDMYAIIGGSSVFLQTFFSALGETENMHWERFIAEMKNENLPENWLTEFVHNPFVEYNSG